MNNSATFADSEDDQLNSLFRQYQVERNRRACLTAAVEDKRISQIDPQAKSHGEPERPATSDLDGELSDEEKSVNEMFRDYQETREEDHSDAIANIMSHVDALVEAKTETVTQTSAAKPKSSSVLARVFNAPGNALDKASSWFTGGSNRWLVPAGATAAALVAFVTVTNVQQETPVWQQVADNVGVPGFSELLEVVPDNLLDNGAAITFDAVGVSAESSAAKQAFVGGKIIATFASVLHTEDAPQIKTALNRMQYVYRAPKVDSVLTATQTLSDSTTLNREEISELLSIITAHHSAEKTAPVFELGVWTVVARQAIDAKLAGVENVPMGSVLNSMASIIERIALSDKVSEDKKGVLTRTSLPANSDNPDELRELQRDIGSIDMVFSG